MNGILVLTRKTGESISIEGVGTITCLESKGGSIRLGLNVDRRFRVVRTELLDQSRTEDPPEMVPA